MFTKVQMMDHTYVGRGETTVHNSTVLQESTAYSVATVGNLDVAAWPHPGSDSDRPQYSTSCKILR